MRRRSSSADTITGRGLKWDTRRHPAWDVAGSEDYDSEEAFGHRIYKANARRLAANKRALLSTTKANAKRYGTVSDHFRFTPSENADPVKMAKALRLLEIGTNGLATTEAI